MPTKSAATSKSRRPVILATQQFHIERRQIQNEKFVGPDKDPFSFGLQRALFKQRMLKKLISLAKRTENSESPRRWLSKWEKELVKVNTSIERFRRYR